MSFLRTIVQSLTVDEVMTNIKRCPRTPTDYEKRNAIFERECFDQAKAELDSQAHSGIEFVIQVLNRAQKIKAARRAKGEGR
jgi:hypothetical protein